MDFWSKSERFTFLNFREGSLVKLEFSDGFLKKNTVLR
ncbi:hypothetical protein VDG1235_2795 [Verrucomicrobiia bacterium DG1235]|nr:hypothetical protein VDG1235_2795 [Verrucomicrobiae bacterium DG1235]